ncbi:bifunctional UDP-sugar hydrolase/5'-nucleotidase UshA [Pseudoalteromonas ruthenica]|uniref:bifunctional UDP-sugar hydrolase/5'-nucleotidase UshA n=1 Tax=Pseudoalteromonas ruthenica TaxID=151081 RepID=UPI0012445678|nr:bifunctional UDP-sugar hydrolase/5'-nucleotidase UshA [Pseudoalteromonas ruthenica]
MRLITLSVLTLLSACSASTPTPESHSDSAQAHYISVFHTNDHHGRFWHNDKGEYGMAARATLLKQLRAQAKQRGDTVLLLSGGDINTGIPESDLQHAEPDFKAMTLLGYDAMAIGNHEFDNPLAVLDKQQRWADFPLLSANIIDKRNGEPAYTPYTLLQRDNLKIAILGLTTTDTAKIANPDFIGNFDFIEPATATKNMLPKIERRNPDIVIAVTHMGHYSNAQHGINAPGDVTLARNLPKGAVDMIIGGHSQEPVCMAAKNSNNDGYRPGMPCQPDNQNGIWIMQAHEWGKYVGHARFKLLGEELTLESYELIPVNLKDATGEWVGDYINKDQEMLDFLTPYQQKGQEKLSVTLGHTEVHLQGDRNKVRFGQTNLGQLITQAQMNHVDADFAVISGGGIRDSISQGDIDYKDILRVHPFKNRIGYIEFSGRETFAYISKVASYPVDSGAYAHFNQVAPVCEGDKLVSVRIDGQPLELDKTYRMSINSYNAAGGDGYPRLNTDTRFVDTGDSDASILSEYVSKHSPIKAINAPHPVTCQ